MTTSDRFEKSVFARILDGELPGCFVYRDDDVAAIMSINPLTTGHTLVIPTQQIAHWIDQPGELAGQVFAVAQRVARAIDDVYKPVRVGLAIAGLEVPHAHVHVTPIETIDDLNFTRAATTIPSDLDQQAAKIAAALL